MVTSSHVLTIFWTQSWPRTRTWFWCSRRVYKQEAIEIKVQKGLTFQRSTTSNPKGTKNSSLKYSKSLAINKLRAYGNLIQLCTQMCTLTTCCIKIIFYHRFCNNNGFRIPLLLEKKKKERFLFQQAQNKGMQLNFKLTFISTVIKNPKCSYVK